MKDKSRLRKRFIELRLRFLQDVVKQKSDIIMSKLFSTDYYKKAKLVMFYVDMRNEVMTKGAIEETLSNGKRVVVPRVKKGYGLLAIEIESLAELTGTFEFLSLKEMSLP